MEVRFNTMNEDVEQVLSFIDKHSRKYFIETAVLYYLRHLKENRNIIDVSLDIDKFENRKTKSKKRVTKKKSETKKEPVVEEVKKVEVKRAEIKVETPSPTPVYNSYADVAIEGLD